MSDIESKVEALIRRKHLIDDMVVDRFTETQRWLVDAVELLLSVYVERQRCVERLINESKEQ